MDVELTPQQEALVRRKIASGRYENADEMIQEALQLLDERDRLAELRAAIAVAEEQIARGEIVEYTPDYMENVFQRARERAATR